MSDTTNESADPWGLPEDDTISAPVEPVKDPAAPEAVETTEEEPVEKFQPQVLPRLGYQESLPEPEGAIEADGLPVETFETLPAEPEIETWAADAPTDADADEPQDPPPADPVSRGPLSQVLAASGFFGGSPVPPMADPNDDDESAEPEEVAEPAAPDEASIDVGALEAAPQDPVAEPPDLTMPTSGAILGLGGTDADLPPEPPPWMVTEPAVGEPDAPAGDGLEDVFEDIAPATEAAIDEAAAGFADISFVEEAAEVATFEDLPRVEDGDAGSAPDSELESLVAELTDTALEVEEDTGSAEVDSDITIDPADTPSVFRELEDLPGSEPFVEFSPVDEATVSFEEVVDQIEDADQIEEVLEIDEDADQIEEVLEIDEDADQIEDVVDDAARSNAEWGVFDNAEEPSEPDTPVFGVTLRKNDEGEDTPTAVDDEDGDAVETVDDQFAESTSEMSELAAGFADTPEGEETIEPVSLDEPTGDLADFAAILPDTPEIEETIEPVSLNEPTGDLADFAAILPDTPEIEETIEPVSLNEPTGDLADFAAILPDTPEIEETIEPVSLNEPTGDLADFAAILPDTAEIEDVIADDPGEFVADDVAGTSDFSDVLEEIESASFAAATPVESETPTPASPDDEIVETISEPEPDDGVPIEWGSRWQESAQGWVEDDQGRSTWRPIVTTSPLLSEWQIDTYLGVVSADVVLGSGPIESEMATGRTSAMRNLVDEAMTRGAHAIVGVSTTMAPVGSATVLTATGTAVTLKAQD